MNPHDLNECTICSCGLDEDADTPVRGCLGILPVAFCGTCYCCLEDMVKQMNEDILENE